MWTRTDERFLRSMRIRSTDPPAALPRFRVEPSRVAGRYLVIDAERDFKPVADVGAKDFPDPRAAAEELARQRNAGHEEKSR